MKCALISDIHGNLEALEAVLKDIDDRKVDVIHCLGDVVGYGCNPAECLELVLSRCKIRLMGNHEFAALGLLQSGYLNDIAEQSLAWTAKQLTEDDLASIADFEMDATIENAYLVHASPYEPDQWHYILSVDEALQGFGQFAQPLGFFGHTHVPHLFSLGPDGTCHMRAGHDFDLDDEKRYLVNVGSVGQPRDNDPRACYAVYDSEGQQIMLRRVEYDIELTQSKMAQAKLPALLFERLEVGR